MSSVLPCTPTLAQSAQRTRRTGGASRYFAPKTDDPATTDATGAGTRWAQNNRVGALCINVGLFALQRQRQGGVPVRRMDHSRYYRGYGLTLGAGVHRRGTPAALWRQHSGGAAARHSGAHYSVNAPFTPLPRTPPLRRPLHLAFPHHKLRFAHLASPCAPIPRFRLGALLHRGGACHPTPSLAPYTARLPLL